MKIILFVLLILTSITGKSQSSYSGNLGKYPITLIMYHHSDGVSLAYYVYNKFDTPITIKGNLKNDELKLFEKDSVEKTTATLIFKDFHKSDKLINGKWISVDKSKTYQISLKKDFDINIKGDDVEQESKELIQASSTEKYYFKTIITKEKGFFYGRVSGVKIFEKKTDRLIQSIKLDCQLSRNNVTVGDFNFDRFEDFSIFEASYTGANTSSIYFLYDPITKTFFDSKFEGTSLIFDSNKKLIYEQNQCCAGKYESNSTYKIVDNKMVLIKEESFELDDNEEEEEED